MYLEGGRGGCIRHCAWKYKQISSARWQGKRAVGFLEASDSHQLQRGKDGIKYLMKERRCRLCSLPVQECCGTNGVDRMGGRGAQFQKNDAMHDRMWGRGAQFQKEWCYAWLNVKRYREK